MLTNEITFEGGLKEILGNVSFNNKPESENLIMFLRKNDYRCEVLSDKDERYADYSYLNDSDLLYAVDNLNLEDNSVIIAELNDFVAHAMYGNSIDAEKSLKQIDDFLARFLIERKFDDIIIITGNYGINFKEKTISREYNPIFVYSKLSNGNKNLRTIQGNNSITMSIVDLLDIYPNNDGLLNDKFKAKIDNFSVILKNEKIANSIDRILEIKPVLRVKNTKIMDKSKFTKKRIKNG